VNCSDAAGRQFGYSELMTKAKQSFTGTLWDNIAQSPYATYKVNLSIFFSSFICETYVFKSFLNLDSFIVLLLAPV